MEQNLHGKQFIDLLKSLELCTLNGRGKDNYTYISRLGWSVVDYCVVELEEFNQFSHFSVTSMQEVIRELQDSSQVSDNFKIHNCLLQPCVSFLYAKRHLSEMNVARASPKLES